MGSLKEQLSEKEKKAVAYDFRYSSKFNKNHLRTLEMIFENYSEEISSFLSGYLKSSVSVSVENAKEIMYKDFENFSIQEVFEIPKIPQPMWGIFDLKPLEGKSVLEITQPIGFCIIDKILGGTGKELKKVKTFSETDAELLKETYEKLLFYLIEPWKNITNLQPKLNKIEINRQSVMLYPRNEMIVHIKLNVEIDKVKGSINFYLPYTVLKSVSDKLNKSQLFLKTYEETATETAEIQKKNLKNALEYAETEISVQMGNATVNVADLLNLQKGDIIVLDSYTDSDLNIYIGELLKFKGKAGVSAGNKAIQITSDNIGKEE